MKFVRFNALLRKKDGNVFDKHETLLNTNAVVKITEGNYGNAIMHLVTGETIEVGYSPTTVVELLCGE